jgi:Putative phage abortive infection protein
MTFNIKAIKKFISDHGVLYIPAFVFLLALALVGVYAKWFPWANHFFHNALNFREAPAWGQIGDFFGGVMNPIIAFCTLIVAALVWRLQKMELKETRDATKQQTFDQFFMSMLASHRSMVEQIAFVDQSGQTLHSGKRAIDSYLQDLIAAAENDGHGHSFLNGSVSKYGVNFDHLTEVKKPLFKIPHKDTERFVVTFCVRFYRIAMPEQKVKNEIKTFFLRDEYLSFEQVFGHLFRSTYQILKIVEERFHVSDENINEAQYKEYPKLKRRYVNLLRAQMSESEFVFFALSALTKDGEKSWARSIQLDFFEDRLQNLPWTQKLAESFAVNEVSLSEAKQILRDE